MIAFKCDKKLKEAFEPFVKGRAVTWHSYMSEEDEGKLMISDDIWHIAVYITDLYSTDAGNLIIKVTDKLTTGKVLTIPYGGVQLKSIKKLACINIAAAFGYPV